MEFTNETTLEIAPEWLIFNPDFIILDPMGNKLSVIPLRHLQTKLNRNNLASGVYFYRLKSSNTTIANGKLVIVE